MTESAMHVLGLTSPEQVTIKLLAQGYLKLLVKAYMNEIQKGADLSATWHKFLESIQRFDDLTGGMASVQTIESTPTKLFQFNRVGIQYLVKIVKSYSATNIDLFEQDELQFIEDGYADLLAKLEMSEQYTYTQSEVQAELRKK